MSNAAGPSAPPRGIPILSGPPPVTESPNCRSCGKQFNPLWRRAHACGHCGYEYCSSCLSDGQALMPRRPGEQKPKGILDEIKAAVTDEPRVQSGYELESVCVPCLGMLQVTSASVDRLRALPVKRLKEYLAAYDITLVGPKEKEDFVQAVVRARDPTTGCLSPEAESFYRRKSVPKYKPPQAPQQQARPTAPRPNGYAQQQYNPHAWRPPPPTNAYPPRQSTQARPPQPYARPTPARPPAPAARPAPTAPARQPSPPIPTVLNLVGLPKSYLSTLTVGQLKGILFDNHVKVDFKQVLEKNELINRVSELVTEERKRLERQARAEEAEAAGTTPPEPANGSDAEESEAVKKPVPTGPVADSDRGLCIVCQDEEATLAVVDCGHLCMCQHCSDIIMATSQECPLCRTRIVTPQRLIRIYRP